MINMQSKATQEQVEDLLVTQSRKFVFMYIYGIMISNAVVGMCVSTLS